MTQSTKIQRKKYWLCYPTCLQLVSSLILNIKGSFLMVYSLPSVKLIVVHVCWRILRNCFYHQPLSSKLLPKSVSSLNLTSISMDYSSRPGNVEAYIQGVTLTRTSDM